MIGTSQPVPVALPTRDRDAPDRLQAKAPVRKSELALTLQFIALLVVFLMSVSTNKNFKWDVFARFVTAKAILSGIGVTLTLTVIASALGLAGGVVWRRWLHRTCGPCAGPRGCMSGARAVRQSLSTCCCGSTLRCSSL